jgi:hypothetical protein
MAARVEAKISVPSGVTVSASTGALASPVTVDVAAGDYYMTAAGGVDGLLETIRDGLDSNVQPYPTTASSVQSAIGLGTWSSGWLFNIASGSDTGAFGGVTLAPSGSPTYGTAGPKAGIDKAVTVTDTAAFTGGTAFDVNATSDLVVAWVAKIPAATAHVRLVSKNGGGGYWFVDIYTAGTVHFEATDGVDTVATTASAGAAFHGEWHVGIAVLDRTAGTMRVATQALASATSYVSATAATAALGSTGAGATFYVGATFAGPTQLAALYIGTGVGVGAGLSAGLATAVSNFASAINASWSVSLTSTGQITVANSFWPSFVAFSSTLRSLLGFAQDFDYPQTASALTEALGGHGTFNAGYLCNESSGSLSAAFGTPATLAPFSSPTYGSQGARGGDDKAIGFDSAFDLFDGGDVFDLTATSDVAFAWVAKFSSLAGNPVIISKYAGAAEKYWIGIDTANSRYFFQGFNSSNVVDFTASSGTIPTNTWHVAIATIDRATGKARIGLCEIGGSPAVGSEATVSAISFSNSANWTIGERADFPGGAPTNGLFSAVYVATGQGSATGLSANLSTGLASFAASLKSQTGTQQAKGVWYPQCPINLDGDPSQAPRATDLRQSEGPTGRVLGLVGNVKYRHRNLVWSTVPRSQVWESAATYDNGSWETFLADVVLGQGHSWFTPSSRVQVWWENAGVDELLGSAAVSGAGLSGWYMKGITSIEPSMVVPGWTGLWRIQIPELVSDG